MLDGNRIASLAGLLLALMVVGFALFMEQ